MNYSVLSHLQWIHLDANILEMMPRKTGDKKIVSVRVDKVLELLHVIRSPQAHIKGRCQHTLTLFTGRQLFESSSPQEETVVKVPIVKSEHCAAAH